MEPHAILKNIPVIVLPLFSIYQKVNHPFFLLRMGDEVETFFVQRFDGLDGFDDKIKCLP
jgi:hypothetical protein